MLHIQLHRISCRKFCFALICFIGHQINTGEDTAGAGAGNQIKILADLRFSVAGDCTNACFKILYNGAGNNATDTATINTENSYFRSLLVTHG